MMSYINFWLLGLVQNIVKCIIIWSSSHLILKVLVFIHFNRKIVGVTGFEPATTRPPDVYATGLRHTPIQGGKFRTFLNFLQSHLKNPNFQLLDNSFSRK